MSAEASGAQAGSPLQAWLRALQKTASIGRDPARTLPVVIDELAVQYGEAPALIAPEGSLSFQGLAAACRRYARWGLAHGLARGDVVALLMPNCPEYLAIWLGLSRIGVSVALLNTNLTGRALAHCIGLVRPRSVIVGAALAEALAGTRGALPGSLPCIVHGDADAACAGCERWPRLDLQAASLSGAPLAPEEGFTPRLSDRALYVFTSGTTGLPKAANVSHLRVMQWSHWFAGLMDTRPGDRMYDCLPLYHSVGGIVATGATWIGGGAVVLRERFSASRFWADVCAQGCTLFQYIGELCRYLLAGPPDALEQRHRLRLCCGNGLRAEVWERFQQRFRIPQILEYYASTEGSFSLYNCEGRVGAIGRIPAFLTHRLPVALVKVDEQSGGPLRDRAGRCVRCETGESGEAIGGLADEAGAAHGRFEGYTDAQASSRKILRDVFAAGDAWYRSGDLMRQDAQGFFYFVDRLGDAFRWKGENVSAHEVASILGDCPGIRDVAVYGVQIPGTEGRAGMAALVVDGAPDLERLRTELVGRLPDYARPLFLRLMAELPRTGTFKLDTRRLAAEGFDPRALPDALYFDDRAAQSYVRLDATLYRRIAEGSVPL